MTITVNTAAYAPAWEGHQDLVDLHVAVKRGDWLVEVHLRARVTEASQCLARELAEAEAEDAYWELRAAHTLGTAAAYSFG